MRRVGVIIAVVAVAAILVTAGLMMALSSGSGAIGFGPSDLNAPSISYVAFNNATVPSPELSFEPSYGVSMSWIITADIFVGYGGVLNLTIRNTNPTGKILVYAFGLEWDNGDTYERNCSVTISGGRSAELGVLIFGAPSVTSAEYRLYLYMAVSNTKATGWYDHGILKQDGWNEVTIKPLSSAYDYTVSENVADYYNRINERVDFQIVENVVTYIQAKYPGNYSVLQIAEAYKWMATNIEYLSDGESDYWQSAGETLSKGTGDCEDQAILMASIIGALGGSARVNVIEQHAFPTVYVTNCSDDLVKIKAVLASYYGVDISTFSMAYLQDEYGYWLVIDTTGFPFVGGLPAMSAPTTTSGNWTVCSSYIYAIDATGVPTSTGLFDLL